MSSPHHEIIGLYQRFAGDWDRMRSHRREQNLFEKPWLDRFLALLPPRSSILDIGCGTGEPIGWYLIERGYRVTGIDASPPLIAKCRERFPDHIWVVADMRSLSLGRQFDGLLAWDSFFHLCPDDQRAMFEIFRIHAAPGAALMFTSASAYGETIATFMGEPLYHASLSEAEYRTLLDRSGFDVVSHISQDSTCGEHTVWLARAR